MAYTPDPASESEVSAVQHGAEQARRWLLERYGEELSGREARHIVAGVGEKLLPFLKISIYAELADALRKTHPEIADAIDHQVQDYMSTGGETL